MSWAEDEGYDGYDRSDFKRRASMQKRGVVEAKAKSGKSIKIGEDWFSVRQPSALANVEKGMEVAFDYEQNGDFKNIDPKTVRTRAASAGAGAPPPKPYSNLGVELGHASNLAMQFMLHSNNAPIELNAWEKYTKEIFARMKEMRTELEQGGGTFNRELANPSDETLDEDDLF